MEELLHLYIVLYFILAAAACSIVLDDNQEGSDLHAINHLALAVGAFCRIKRRVDRSNNNAEEPPRKRKRYDYERAYLCIQQDYLGPEPQYGSQFERIFRVSRGIVECFMQVLGNADPFFTCRVLMIGGDMGIYLEAKVLMALQTLAFGCAPQAFMAYYQMGRTSSRECLKRFARIVSHSHLREEYMRQMKRNVDFSFTVGGQVFTKLWLFVDGIYPVLSRFIKTISVPIGKVQKKF
jgi:hypothetical protein